LILNTAKSPFNILVGQPKEAASLIKTTLHDTRTTHVFYKQPCPECAAVMN
jgi:hypothetical protein